jgi:hypothetical protein
MEKTKKLLNFAHVSTAICHAKKLGKNPVAIWQQIEISGKLAPIST